MPALENSINLSQYGINDVSEIVYNLVPCPSVFESERHCLFIMDKSVQCCCGKGWFYVVIFWEISVYVWLTDTNGMSYLTFPA